MNQKMSELHIGLDDTDSQKGMCSTYVVSQILQKLDLRKNLISPPELVRLNPTIPWKTRGNGALSIRLKLGQKNIENLKKEIIELVEEYREESSNSGVVFFDNDPRNIEELRDFSKKAVKEIVKIQNARELAKEYGEAYEFGNGQGVVGAVCAVGYVFSDYTFELIGYRKKERWGTERDLEKNSVKKISKKYSPTIWDNFDWRNSEMVLSPNSPCPVLFGIRGDSKERIIEASKELRGEEVVLKQLFKTNQGTDEHLQHKKNIDKIKPYTSVIIKGEVVREPETIEGGHVILGICGEAGNVIDCAAYEPTKDFRNTIRKLIKGDTIKVFGGVRKKPLTINLEKIKIIDLAINSEEKNPVCPDCGNRMESAGKEQGYRCRKCSTFANKKVKIFRERELEEKVYEVPPTARRHLSKPLIREEQD
ncbi:hypothetical protein C9439_01265 [archaeon SCG-AAA382B04]|nr:hypothetical protein C9439_01265 [archaeon SCG-AAA382B04]